MKGKCVLLLTVVMALTLFGCATGSEAPKTQWVSQPPLVEVDHTLFTASVRPQKGDFPFYTAFVITLANQSGRTLNLDWNASQYIFNGRAQGPLVFKGIEPAAVKAGTIAPESIAPGETFSRRVMPLRLIAWNTVREKSAGGPAIRPGMIPAGRNGIRLVVDHGKGKVVVPLSVEIAKQHLP